MNQTQSCNLTPSGRQDFWSVCALGVVSEKQRQGMRRQLLLRIADQHYVGFLVAPDDGELFFQGRGERRFFRLMRSSKSIRCGTDAQKLSIRYVAGFRSHPIDNLHACPQS
jgi:hypothetical protein